MSFHGSAPAASASLLLLRALALAAAAFALPALVTHAPSARAQESQPPQQQPTPTPQTTPQPTPQTTPQPQQQVPGDDVERVDTDLATLVLTAVDKERRFVTTLRPEDVRVYEDGVAQTLSAFQRETDLPVSLAIVVDTSRSQQRTLPEEKEAALSFINSVIRPAKDAAAVLSFTGKPALRQPLTNDAALLRTAVENLQVEIPENDPDCRGADDLTVEQEPRCWSAIWDAAWAAVADVLAQTPPQTRRAVILLSDGDDTTSFTKKTELIDFAVRSNAVIYSIGIGDREYYKVDEGSLRKISERTGGRAFFPETRAELDAAFAQINQELRAQYLIAYTPTNRRRDGSFRRLRVEVVNDALKKQKLRLLYREGYYAKSDATPSAKSGDGPKN